MPHAQVRVAGPVRKVKQTVQAPYAWGSPCGGAGKHAGCGTIPGKMRQTPADGDGSGNKPDKPPAARRRSGRSPETPCPACRHDGHKKAAQAPLSVCRIGQDQAVLATAFLATLFLAGALTTAFLATGAAAPTATLLNACL